MGKTRIEWTDMSWPVVTGCSHAGSPGCDMCYAARMAATRLKHHPRYEGLATFENGKARWTGEVRLNHDVLEQPLHWKKPRRIFVASMGDLFHKDVLPWFTCEIWQVMRECPQHIFQILTKHPRRMLRLIKTYIADHEFGIEPLPNVWLGVSVENQAAADERIPWLLRTPAAVHYVSVEPLLEAIVLPSYDEYIYPDGFENNGPMSTTLGYAHEPDSPIDWVIVGGESGPGARPMHPDWTRGLRNQCYAANVPYFFKQHGAWLHESQFSEPVTIHTPGIVTFEEWNFPTHQWDDNTQSYRVGKKRAGHLLDGRAWQEFPRMPKGDL